MFRKWHMSKLIHIQAAHTVNFIKKDKLVLKCYMYQYWRIIIRIIGRYRNGWVISPHTSYNYLSMLRLKYIHLSSLRMSDAYMRQWTRPSLVQIMAFRLFGILIQEMHLKMCSGKCRPFCLGLSVLIIGLPGVKDGNILTSHRYCEGLLDIVLSSDYSHFHHVSVSKLIRYLHSLPHHNALLTWRKTHWSTFDNFGRESTCWYLSSKVKSNRCRRLS